MIIEEIREEIYTMGERLSRTQQEAKLRNEMVEKFYDILQKNFEEVFFTKDLYTLTVPVGQIDDVDRYCSIKIVLHKPEFNLDDACEEYEEAYEERQMKEKLKAEKAALKKKNQKELDEIIPKNKEE